MSSSLQRPATGLAPAEPPSGPGFSLAEVLRSGTGGERKLSRSEATRQRLLVAAAEVMQTEGFNDLKVADICKRAGCAHGTFYLHWQDRRGVAHDVLTAFMEAIRAHRPARRPGQSFYERLVAGHLYYIDVYRRNVGLMRCQGQLSDHLEEFARIGIEANTALARRVVRAVEREAGVPASDERQLLATALACIAMVDKLLHEVFVRGLDIGLDDSALAENLSRIWHRALVGSDPA